MSAEGTGTIHGASDGGVAGKHPPAEPFEALVGPSTAGEFNTARLRLIPVACWRVDDIRFHFGSSFVTPDIETELRHLASLVKEHPGSPLSIFGHADPVGSDDYNKGLSGRRATAIYGMLTRNTDLWDHLYSQPFGGDNWGTKALQAMQAATGLPAGTPRKALFKAYMDKLCGEDLKLKKEDFLAHGADAGGKGDYQGCGEFNPVLIFSQEENAKFEQAQDKKDRNAANAPNRRVMALLFRKGSRVDPVKWPCPRATEGVAGCRKRFWSDGEKRRSKRFAKERREFKKTQDTFACRFYQRLAAGSPCEHPRSMFRIRLFDRLARPLPAAPYMVIVEGTERPPDKADGNGDITVQDVRVPATCTVYWSRPEMYKAPAGGAKPKPEDFEFSLEVFLDIEGGGKEEAEQETDKEKKEREEARRRLHNLGFSMGDSLEENIRFFQRECGQQETGLLKDIEAELKKRYEACDPPSRYKTNRSFQPQESEDKWTIRAILLLLLP